MRYVGLIINQIGRRTRNRRDLVTSTAGIQDDDILDALNDAQERIQSVVLQQLPHCTFFDTRTAISIAANTATYDIPENAFLNATVRAVEYRSTANESDYRGLQFLRSTDDILNETSSEPTFWTLDGRQIRVSPIPVAAYGNIRVRYPALFDRMDKRRGKVLTATSSGSPAAYTSIELDSTDTIDDDAINNYVGDYLCISDKYGNVIQRNLLISSFGSNIITLSGIYPVSDGTISSGHYVTLGKYTTTHSKLPQQTEKHLRAYAQSELYESDSDDRAIAQKIKLGAIEDEILGLFANSYLGKEIPIIHEGQWLDGDYY